MIGGFGGKGWEASVVLLNWIGLLDDEEKLMLGV
jgi:hypothetical protein